MIIVKNRKVVLQMKVIGKVLAVIGIILVLWVMISFIDINFHNSPFSSDYLNYADWNFFSIVFGAGV